MYEERSGNNVTGVLCTMACTLALQILCVQVAVAKLSIKVVLTVAHTGQCLQTIDHGVLNHTIQWNSDDEKFGKRSVFTTAVQHFYLYLHLPSTLDSC